MFNAEVRALLAEVLTSWQVIVVTIVIILYITIVRRAASLYVTGRHRSGPKQRRVRPAKNDIPPPSESDDLGLEEEDASPPDNDIIEEDE
ncbi:MAG: hypothetical protein FWG77_11600 [Treponema sp.]|nr:hypothetical protein [Treponema sp.]